MFANIATMSVNGGYHGNNERLSSRSDEVLGRRAPGRDGSYSNASDYVRHLIRRDQERARAIAQLQAAITEGMESGEARPFDVTVFKARMRAAQGQ